MSGGAYIVFFLKRTIFNFWNEQDYEKKEIHKQPILVLRRENEIRAQRLNQSKGAYI